MVINVSNEIDFSGSATKYLQKRDNQMRLYGAEHRNIVQLGKYSGALHLHYSSWGFISLFFFAANRPKLCDN